MKVAVAGGTGVVGRHVVSALSAAGHETVTLSRARGVDLTSGAGLDAAIAGAEAVIDVSNVMTTSRRRAVEFFEATTGHLLAAGQRAGVEHHVALSIVGVDRVDFGYYEGKRRQEELVLQGPLDATVLRATQFHEFAEQTLARTRGPVAVVPHMLVQPIAAREVADALVQVALGPAAGLAPDLAGPERHTLHDMVRQVRRAQGSRRLLLPIRVPGPAGRAMATGALLPTGTGPRGQITFAHWLAERR